tara:strand:- start:129 stop:470 length:342 start_codon:yes stop_codon:yes gene_type:complete
MAINPATYDMTVQRRADHSIDLIFKQNNGNAINLTGYSVASQVWDQKRIIKYADFSVAYTDRAAGKISISLTDTQTSTFKPEILKYDVALTNPSGLKEYYLEGNIFVSEGYTA